jgi:LPXTG-motif cell wall-anchored protein
VDAAPASATQRSTGSAGPFLIGAVMAALLAGSGGLIAWRRRRAG